MFTRQDKKNAWLFQVPVYRLAMELAIEVGAKTALDIGCGVPEKLRGFIYPITPHICGIDKFLDGFYDVYEDMDYYKADLETTTLDVGKRFDLIICADVVEHISNIENLFNLIKRHAHKDSVIVISTPEKASVLLSDVEQNPDHKNCWSKEEFVRLLIDYGFEVTKSQLVKEIGGYDSHICFCKVLRR